MKDGKYEEALERAKQGLPIDKIFPELNESEDERIRKWLIDYFDKVNDEVVKEGRLKIIAYLEKQKDKRELDFAEGKVEGVRQTCQEIKDAMSLFEPKDLTPFEFTFRDYIDSAIRYCLAGEGYQQYIKEWAADLLNLERQNEQKPAEWSEEDEALIENVCTALKGYALHERKVDLDEHAHRLEEMSERLKSLRPQPHWKPSEEQVNALKNARYMMSQCGDYYDTTAIIDSLITDLQKLL